MGCGKSYWGRQLAQKLQVPFLDLDEQIEDMAGKKIAEIFAVDGEEFFRRREKEMLMHLTESTPAFVMSTGGGTPCFFNNIDYMNRMGKTIWINCSAECLAERLKGEKEKRPLISTLDDEQLKAYIVKKVGDRKIFYQQAREVIYEDQLSLDNFLDKILNTENKN
ncbi:hypothetical protein BUE76_13970 [Cnuella takakiae]|nr:hypothetical protein BUE76_13970 [Cnuella takakiae]